jgi:asparagine synthase (glutamine-hydrolysing)
VCGIAGIYREEGVEEDVLRRMAGALAHRGPDGEGIRVDGAVGLAHRRLSIIDLEGGAQPMTNESGKLWIVYNGEIYNFPDLRDFLIERGHRFRTRSDTEVVLHLYEELGEDCVHRLDGMFAFAIWDGRDRSFFLARDHLGQKPLFWTLRGGTFAFASEPKALTGAGLVPMEPDHDGLLHFISLRFIAGEHSLFRGIRKLEAATRLRFRGGDVRTERYWRLDYRAKRAGSDAEQAEALRELLRRTVASHRISDVEIGAFLSGGIDSGTVTALLASAGPGRINTFSVGSNDPDFDERPYARELADRYSTNHREMAAQPDMIPELPGIIHHLDEPADPFAFGVFNAAKLASRHVKVVLGGDGGDEMFGGYDRYAGQRLVDLYCFVPRAVRSRVITPLLRLIPDQFGYNSPTQKLRWLHAMSFEDAGLRYQKSMSYLRFTREALEDLLTESFRRGADLDGISEKITRHFDAAVVEDTVDRMLYTDVMTRIPDHLLTIVDRMTMMFGLEDRSPLLDRHVAEFAAATPARCKVRGRRLKAILKDAARPLLPASFFRRRKQGFSFPIAAWFRGPLGGLFETLLERSRVVESGMFNGDYLRRLLSEHRSGRLDHNYRLWAVLNVELWYRLNIEGVPRADLAGWLAEGIRAPVSVPAR